MVRRVLNGDANTVNALIQNLNRLKNRKEKHILICRTYLHMAGKKEEKAELEIVRTSRHSSRQLLRLGVRLLRFYEFFVGKKNKTRILSRCSSEAER